MRHLPCSIGLCLVACTLACSDDSSRADDTFGTLDSGPGSSGTMGDGDPGDGDPGDGDPGDGDPGDGDPGDGDPGDGDPGDGDPGDGDGDAQCDRTLYIHELGAGNWSEQPLDVAWSGPNAPPCDVEILATTYLEPWDQLLVFGGDGMYYRRIGAVWEPPENIGARWALLADANINSMTYTPPINGVDHCGLIFSALPDAYLYNVYEDGGTSFDQVVTLTDGPPPEAPQGSSTRRWAAVLADGALIGQAAWWTSWNGFDNGNVYRIDGAFTWTSWPQNQAPVLSGAPGSLNPNLIEAGWGDYDLDRVYLVGR